jgi:hypothetical protein
MRALLLWPIAHALLAQQPVDSTRMLVRARDVLVERDRRLPDYTCVQTVDRQYFKRRAANDAQSCSQIAALSPDTLLLQSTDRLRLELKVSHGEEIGSWPGSRFTASSIFDLIGNGPYGTGMLGSFIADIFIDGHATYTYAGDNSAGPVYVYNYQVPAQSSHYHVKAGSQWPVSAFHGAFWLDSNSLELKRLIVQTSELPPETGACEIATNVEYRNDQVGDGVFLLPARSTIRMLMRDQTQSQTTAIYSNCHEYRGESTIHFDDLPAGARGVTAAAPAPPLPEGLALSLALTEPIDLGTAAAGDLVKARLRRAVREPHGKGILAPAGAIVNVRIVEIQHWLDPPPTFTLGLLLENLTVGGGSRPLYAVIHREGVFALPRLGQSPLVATFTFGAGQPPQRVPVGFQTDWLTVAPVP